MTILYLVSAERNDAFEQGQKLAKEAEELERRLSKPNKRRKPETEQKMQDRLHWCLEKAQPLLKSEMAGYWKVGITDRKDRNPLNRDRKRYREVFRSIETPLARDVELLIARTFNQLTSQHLLRSDLGRETLAYPAPLERAEEIFDGWLQIVEAASAEFNPAPIGEKGFELHWPYLPEILEHLQASDGARDCSCDEAWHTESTYYWPQFHFGTGWDTCLNPPFTAQEMAAYADEYLRMAAIFAPKVAELHDRVLRPLDLGFLKKPRELAQVGMW